VTRWSRMFRQGIEQAEVARNTQVQALNMRCAVRDSGGARCTADALPPGHVHRHDPVDLPGALADEERWKA
jgi:hypothetical protein